MPITRSMRRFASLPIAVRLGAAFGLLALALAAVTLIATHAFGTFRDDTQGLADRDMRAVAIAGALGQNLQAIGRETADHLYVYDGDLASQDEIAVRVDALRQQAAEDSETLAELSAGTAPRTRREFNARVTAWTARVERALRLSRRETVENVEERTLSRELYTGEISLRCAAALGGGRGTPGRRPRRDRRHRRGRRDTRGRAPPSCC